MLSQIKKLLLLFLFFVPVFSFSQKWVQEYDSYKRESSQSFIEVRNAFNQFSNSKGVVKGITFNNGLQHKVPMWKQFKRWEWYWEPRVNNVTGVFNTGKSIDAYYKQNILMAKSNTAGDWKSLGPSDSDGGYSGTGRINCVAFHPSNNNIFWVGSPSGGLWRTDNGGASWQVLTDNNAVLGVSDIVIPSDYETSKTIYIATGDKNGGSAWTIKGMYASDNNSIGVLKSADGGNSWQTTGLTFNISENKQVGRLLMHPSNNKILFAGTSNGISKSVDAGLTWLPVFSGAYVIDIEFKPGNPDVLYASTKDYWGEPKILRSLNAGSTWTVIREFVDSVDYRIELAVSQHDENYVYALVANIDGGLSGIYRSINSGESFNELINGNDAGGAMLGYYSDASGVNEGQGGYDLCIAASPTNRNVVFVGGINTWKTTNGGISWSVSNMWTDASQYNISNAPVVHADKHSLVFRKNGDLFETNDGGIYISNDEGNSWADITNNMVISQMYRIGVSQTNASMVIAGLQDNGTKLFDLNAWTDIAGGDGMECIIDYTDENTQYATYINGEIYRTTNKWVSQQTISDNISDGGAWVTPYVIDGNNNSTLYAGYSDIYKTTNKGDSFTKISDINTSEKIRSLAVAPSNSNVLYAADFGHIWKTVNGGAVWSDITFGLPDTTNSITYIAVKADDEQTVWVAMSGYNGKGVYKTTDGGETWSDISAGLPELPVLCVIQNKQITDLDQIYAATDRGIFVKHGNNNWINFSNGLPNVVITELEIYYNSDFSKSRLRAASYGRGLWESSLYGTLPVANFTVSETEVLQTDTVQFTDMSENGVYNWNWIFEGGKPHTSILENPKVVYDTAGVYKVTLISANEFGVDTLVKENYITVTPLKKPVPGFEASKTNVYANEYVSFYDTSLYNPTWWYWEFEGGVPTESNLKAPIINYAVEGNYTVSLRVGNSVGDSAIVKTNYIKVSTPVPPVSGFKASAVSVFEGKSVVFTDTSLNVPTTWQWTFEGGTPTSSGLQNPTVVYNDIGTYKVSLIVLNKTGADTLVKDAYIEVKPVLQAKAAFTASSVVVAVDQLVQFTNTSENANTYFWDFGDGSTSADENPVHSYSEIKMYDVTLTASNENNSHTESKLNYIDVISSELIADFTASPTTGIDSLVVTFTNKSENANTFSWKFGDGGTSNEVNPVYTYKRPGEYSVTLTASNSVESKTHTKSNYIEVSYRDPLAEFTASPLVGSAPLTVVFTDLSDNAYEWTWDFGDNTEVKHDQHPTHVFNKGTFDVTLLVSNPSGVDLLVKENYINVDPNNLPGELQEKLKVFPNPVTNLLNVVFKNEKQENIEILLFDSSGKLVYKTRSMQKAEVVQQIDMSAFEAGTYMLRINTNEHIVVLSIVKQ